MNYRGRAATALGGGVLAIVLGAAAAGAPLMAAALVGAAICVVAVREPLLALCLLVGATVAFEDPILNGLGGQGSFLSFQYAFYDRFPGHVAPPDILLVCTAVGTVLKSSARGRSLEIPRPFVLPLGLFAVATVCGFVTGVFGGASSEALLNPTRVLVYLLVVPWLVVNLVSTPRQLNLLLGALAAGATVKGVEGIVVPVLQGQGLTGGAGVVFYTPATNWLLVLLVLGTLGAAVVQLRVPWWVYLGAGAALLALMFSLRRGFWLALVVGAVALLLAAPRRRVAAVLPLFIAGLILIWGVLGGLLGPEARTAFSDRASSLTLTKLQTTREDRYRLSERTNVLDEIERAPLTGLGLGVPWSARTPMPVEYRGARNYSHIVVLLHWMRLGVLGALAYIVLTVAILLASLRLARASPDLRARALGLAVFGATLGLAVAETTGSHTGSNLRHTIIISVMIGAISRAYVLHPGEERVPRLAFPVGNRLARETKAT